MSKAKIMIVEDEFVVVQDMKRTIEKIGFEVVGQASTGEEAIRLAGELKPDLILMDIKLVGPMDGTQAAIEINKNYVIPVVFITAYIEDSLFRKAKQSNPYGIILKPFSEFELRAGIEIVLQKSRDENKLKADVKTLSGFLSVCANCKKIKDESGTWQQMEAFFEKHMDVLFSHGICPDCVSVLYPDDFLKNNR